MLKRIAFFILFVVASIAFAIFITFWLGRVELRKQRQAYLDAGGILDPNELLPPPILDEVNAAVAYVPIFDFLSNLAEQEEGMLGDELSWNEPATQKFLAKCAPTLAAIHVVAEMPECRWDDRFDFDVSRIESSAAHLWNIGRAVALLETSVRAEAARAAVPLNNQASGDEQIIRDLETIIKLSLHLAADPTFGGQFAAGRCMQTGIDLYEEMFRDQAAPVNEIRHLLASFDHSGSRLRALHSDVIYLQTNWDRLLEEEWYFVLEDMPWYTSYLSKWDQAYFLEAMPMIITETTKPMHEIVRPPEPPWYAVMSQMALADILGNPFATTNILTRLEMFKIAERLRAYKSEHGSYPAADIFEMPINPASGNPFQYEVIGEGFVITNDDERETGPDRHWVWDK